MNVCFDNKKILVTGGSRGIGKEIALAFLSAGNCNLVITGKSENAPEWMESFPSSNLRYHQLDLSEKNWLGSFKKLVEELEGFDVCINNAGINSVHPVSEFPQEKIQEILSVNLEAPILITGVLSKYMAKNQYGRIVNIASIFGVVSKAHRSAYTASKAGLIGVTKTMALDLAPSNILVNAVSPGFIETDLTRQVLGESGIQEMTKRIPQGRLGRPTEIANYILFLASDFNTYMTGQNIVVDGGFVSE